MNDSMRTGEIDELRIRFGISQLRPVSAASSTDRCNTFYELLSWRLIEQGLLPPRRNRPLDTDRVTGDIEVEIGGMTVRVGSGADARTVVAVIRALKAGA